MATTIKVEIDENTLKRLIIDYLSNTIDHPIKLGDVIIQVKSKQNYKSEWEVAAFRAELCLMKDVNDGL